MAGHMNPGKIEHAKNFKAAVKDVARYLGVYKIAIIFVALFAITSTIFNIIGPKILGKATTLLTEGLMNKITGIGSIDFSGIGHILLTVLAIYVIGAILGVIQEYIMSGITQKMCYRLRKEISEKINKIPMMYFEKKPYGEVLSRITNDVDTVGQSLNQSVTTIITSICTAIGAVIMMLTISPLMTLVIAIVFPLSAFLIGTLMRKSQRLFRKQQESLGIINGQVEENYSGHLVIKAFSKEKDMIDSFGKENEKLYEYSWKSQFFAGLMMPLMSFIGNLGYVAVIIMGGLFIINGTVTIGDVQAFTQYVNNVTMPIRRISQVINQVQSMAAAAERVFEFLRESEEDNSVEESVPAESISGNVSFNNISFGYTKDKTIIHNFSIDVKKGEKVAIVGPTGAGKSTIIKLLMRFYDVDDGSISLDGRDIKTIKKSDLRTAVSMVLQDTWLFNGSIMDNIRYSNLSATDEEVINASKIACADSFIKSLPDGYNMLLNEEATNVSQGQKQLLTIARAFLADSKIIILDEATSSVDTRTETLIQQAMDRLMEGKTSFIIAHRLSTIKNADKILVMKDGNIVEQGNHSELLAKNGIYSELYNSQFAEL